MMLLAFDDEAELAQRLAQAPGRPLALVQQRRRSTASSTPDRRRPR